MDARWEALGDGCGVYVTKEHGFTTDTLLLAWFSQPKRGEICADFGSGCGTIPMLWRGRGAAGPILAVELQREAAELAARSAEKNEFEAVKTVCGDVREYRTILPHQGLDLIACNPPYYPLGSGDEGQGPRRTARHTGAMDLRDVANAACWGLRWGGRLCICLRTERLAEAVEVFRQGRLEPKRLRLVQSGPEKAPYLFLLECRYGGKTGLAVEPVLTLNGPDGRPTEELRRVYGGYQR